ncbi:MAG: hypothetical protein HOY69_24650 [Streptomyces sp.]|nr:hypothetical protein [Streptomyces sp.]
MNVTITLGGLFVGLVLIVRQFAPAAWAAIAKKGKGASVEGGAPGGKFNIRDHLGFLVGATIGMLVISMPGGVLGQMAAKVVGISNSVGDKVVSGASGAAAAAVNRAAPTAMTAFGTIVTLLLVAAVFFLRKHLEKRVKGQMFAGIWCGTTLGLSAGAAGLTAAVLIPLVNQAGQLIGGQL